MIAVIDSEGVIVRTGGSNTRKKTTLWLKTVAFIVYDTKTDEMI